MAVTPQVHAAHTGFLNGIRSGFGIPTAVGNIADKVTGVTRFINPNAGKSAALAQVKGVSANKPFMPSYGNAPQTFGVHER